MTTRYPTTLMVWQPAGAIIQDNAEVLAATHPAVRSEIAMASHYACDLDITGPADGGLWVWVGYMEYRVSGGEYGCRTTADVEISWHGQYRRPSPEELVDFVFGCEPWLFSCPVTSTQDAYKVTS